jgi:outer membrane phospholipase A
MSLPYGKSSARAAVFLSGLLLCGMAGAVGLEETLVAPIEPVAAGQPARFTLLLVNPTDESLPATFEPELSCRLDSPSESFPVQATARPAPGEGPTRVPPNGFARQEYEFVVPPAASAQLVLHCEALATPPALLVVRPAAADGDTEPEAEAGKAGTAGTVRQGLQEFTSRFAPFEPFYFLVGIDPENSKFQFSFDYHFLNTEGPLAQRYPWVAGFHFAYTQTSLWDLASESAPFRDTSYKPELHFLSPRIPWELRWLERFQVRVGFQHESNGRGGVESRSTNFIYAKPILVFGSGEPWKFEIGPKAWFYVANDDETNRDLPDYRGYFDLELSLLRSNSFQLTTHLGWAQEGGTIQVDLTYPLTRLFFGNLELYAQAQYFNGYAETLLRFDERNEAFRLGFSMIR